MLLPHHQRSEYPVHISQDLAAAPPALLLGQHLADRYQVIERIGGGGMADVYRGRDLWLSRDVAIKVLKPALASEEMCARMLQEGRAAAAIDHAHLLRVLDIGRVGDTREARGSVYLVTDLLQGSSLAELLRQLPEGRLAWRRALELLLPALEALDLVHQHGYIHRDLKPDNLFIHRRNGVEVLMVLDLGIAKLAPALRGDDAPVPTESGRVLGTPAYMSPEQAGGAPLDHRTDIYSIAVTLHRMLAGRLPFEVGPGEGPIALMAHHLYDPPPRLAPPEPIPELLADTVLRALSKAPSQRPASMIDFADELRDCLAQAPANPVATASFERSGSVHRVGRIFGGMAVMGALVAFRGSEPPESASMSVVATTPVPALASQPAREPAEPVPAGHEPEDASARVAAPEPDPPPAPTPPVRPVEPPRARRSAAVDRVFAGAAEPVARCMRDHGSLELRALTVTVTARRDGSVSKAVLRDSSAARLCVRPIVERLRFGAGPAEELSHTFHRLDAGAP